MIGGFKKMTIVNFQLDIYQAELQTCWGKVENTPY